MDNELWQNVFNVGSAKHLQVREDEKEFLSFNYSHADQSRAATTAKFLIVLNVRCLCRPRPRKVLWVQKCGLKV